MPYVLIVCFKCSMYKIVAASAAVVAGFVGSVLVLRNLQRGAGNSICTDANSPLESRPSQSKCRAIDAALIFAAGLSSVVFRLN